MTEQTLLTGDLWRLRCDNLIDAVMTASGHPKYEQICDEVEDGLEEMARKMYRAQLRGKAIIVCEGLPPQ